ncbi:MAG: NAD(P)(+) transhydrogenase (Re/Si-specific) subunit beta, partial [Alphaproteobacteria bacterium]|nr:NAD(P)(+) transhydrogenase (Re/Si-specific) subunit beta [Alphaproteobacteria bacterium]
MSSQDIVDLTALAYLIAGVLFIMALRGLSSPESSRKGNIYGMIGMVIAIVTTLLNPEIVSYQWIAVAIVIGGTVGIITAMRISMTAMPQLVAAFHSLVGFSAVLIAAGAFLEPANYGIVDAVGQIFAASRVEMSLGAAIGAITFSGSIIAFAKLNGNMSGKPIMLPGRHIINAALAIAIVGMIVTFALSNDAAGSPLMWWIIGLSFLIGFLIIIPIGGADMPVVVSMLNSYSGWAAAGIGFTLQNNALIIT